MPIRSKRSWRAAEAWQRSPPPPLLRRSTSPSSAAVWWVRASPLRSGAPGYACCSWRACLSAPAHSRASMSAPRRSATPAAGFSKESGYGPPSPPRLPPSAASTCRKRGASASRASRPRSRESMHSATSSPTAASAPRCGRSSRVRARRSFCCGCRPACGTSRSATRACASGSRAAPAPQSPSWRTSWWPPTARTRRSARPPASRRTWRITTRSPWSPTSPPTVPTKAAPSSASRAKGRSRCCRCMTVRGL